MDWWLTICIIQRKDVSNSSWFQCNATAGEGSINCPLLTRQSGQSGQWSFTGMEIQIFTLSNALFYVYFEFNIAENLLTLQTKDQIKKCSVLPTLLRWKPAMSEDTEKRFFTVQNSDVPDWVTFEIGEQWYLRQRRYGGNMCQTKET